MAGQRQPIQLLEYKGKKHLTKEEIAKRRTVEIDAPANNVKPPGYLNESQKQEFCRISQILLEIGIMSDLDCDALARYVKSQSKYLKYDFLVDRILSQIDPDNIGSIKDACDLLKEYEGLRDKAFKQCRAAASDLGLTITSRCKLVIPKAPERPVENKFQRFVK